MKKFILPLSALFFLCINVNTFAQVATNYLFSDSIGSYNEIVGDIVVAVATHTSTDPLQLNDVTYGPNALPFPFIFNDISYTSFMINTNGFITFGATAPVVANYGPVSSVESYEGSISAFGVNLIGLFGTTGNATISSFTLSNVVNFEGVITGRMITAATGIPAETFITAFNVSAGTITMSKAATSTIAGLGVQIASGSIVRSTQGTAPFRVHTIQFKDFRRYLIIGSDDNYNFQIKLFETTGTIHVVYGNMDEISSGIFGQVGLRGSVNTDFNNRTNSVTLNWDNSTAGGSNSATSKLSNTLFPVSGTTYIWRGRDPVAANIKIIVQGFYNTGTNRLSIRDTVRAYLRNNLSPFNIVDSAKSVIDSITFTGNFLFSKAQSGTYYIQMKHRNSIETWSKSNGQPYTRGSAFNYDFTDIITKAYGSNMIQQGIKFCIYNGDVNQDGTIDLTDLSLIDNDANNFAAGYLVTDLNGDYFVDLSDYTIADNNANNFVSAIRP